MGTKNKIGGMEVWPNGGIFIRLAIYIDSLLIKEIKNGWVVNMKTVNNLILLLSFKRPVIFIEAQLL